MGGGISVLMPDMAEKLNQSSLDKFHELENECVLNNLTPVDMYLFLTAKYEELLTEEKLETIRLMKESKLQLDLISNRHNSETNTSTGDGETAKKIKKPTHKRPWGTSIKLGNSNLAKSKSKKRISTRCVPKSLFCASDDSDDVDCNDLTCRLSDESRHESTSSTTNLLISEIDSGNKSSTVDLPLVSSHSDGMNDLAFECELCKKIFDTKNMLDTHVGYSQMHAKALAERDLKFRAAYEGAEHLARLAKSSVLVMKDKLSLRKEFEDGFMTLNKYRWKHAVSKVIDRYLASHYEEVVRGLSFTPFASSEVKLLYSGTKFFWRIKATFNIHIYLHVNSDCVEVIPQLLPSNTDVLAEGQTVRDVLERTRISRRIYLNHRQLKEQLFGLPKSLVDAGTNMHATQRNLNIVVEEDHRTQQDIDLDLEMQREAEAAALLANPVEAVITTSVDDAMGLFVLNRLQLDFLGIAARSVAAHDALVFECRSKVDTPVLSAPPRNLCPVVVESAKIYQQWEVKRKMQQLADSQKALSQAVDCAMSISQRTEELLALQLTPKKSFRACRPVISTACDAPPEMFSPKGSSAMSNPTSAGTGRRWTFVV
jgi:hypothetical protein